MKPASQKNADRPAAAPNRTGEEAARSEAVPKLALSVVVPAYNERLRLPPYLESMRHHLDHDLAGCYEVIVVDDGSSDGLADDLDVNDDAFPQLRVIRHSENRGKGAAVRTGVLAAEGRFVLFADADGATPIEEERRLRRSLESGADIAVGSRRVASAQVERSRHPLRRLVGITFAATAKFLLGLSVRDTQCGFKMLRREVVARIFPRMREDGYYFDLEMLILADRCGYCVKEVPINWSDRPGSRMSFARELGRMLGAFWRLRRLKKRLHE